MSFPQSDPTMPQNGPPYGPPGQPYSDQPYGQPNQPGSPYQAHQPYQQPGPAYQQPGSAYQQPGAAYPQPGYAYPQQPYGAQPGYAYPYPTYNPSAHTNTMAILSLVFAFVFAPVSIVLGHMARKQIRERGESGDGLALAGLILGYIFTTLMVLFCGLFFIGMIEAMNDASTANTT